MDEFCSVVGKVATIAGRLSVCLVVTRRERSYGGVFFLSLLSVGVSLSPLTGDDDDLQIQPYGPPRVVRYSPLLGINSTGQ